VWSVFAAETEQIFDFLNAGKQRMLSVTLGHLGHTNEGTMEKGRSDITLRGGEKAAMRNHERDLHDALEDDNVSEALQRLHRESTIFPNNSKSPADKANRS
jgi:hypothetical protein